MRSINEGPGSPAKDGDISMIGRPLVISGYRTKDGRENSFDQPVKALLEFHRFRIQRDRDQTIISPAGQNPGVGYEDATYVKAAYKRKTRRTRVLNTENFARLHNVETRDLHTCTPQAQLSVSDNASNPGVDDWALDLSRAEWNTRLLNLDEEQHLSRGVRAHRNRDYLLLLQHNDQLEVALTTDAGELWSIQGTWSPGLVVGSMGMYALIRPKTSADHCA